MAQCRYLDRIVADGLKGYIEEDFLVDKIVVGQTYHTTWASKIGMEWICDSIDPLGKAVLRKPIEGTLNPSNVERKYLRHTNQNAFAKKTLRQHQNTNGHIARKIVATMPQVTTDVIMAESKEITYLEPSLDELVAKAEAKKVKEKTLFWSQEETDLLKSIIDANQNQKRNSRQIADIFAPKFPQKNYRSVKAKVYAIRVKPNQRVINSDEVWKAREMSDKEKEVVESVESAEQVNVIDETPVSEEIKTVVITEKDSVAYHNANELPEETKIFKGVTINSDYGPLVVDIKVTGVFKIEIVK